MQLSTDLKNSRVQLIAETIDAGNATLQLKNEADDIVCELLFANPCALTVENGTLTFKSLAESMVLLSDAITSGTILNQDSSSVAQLTVGDQDSNADIKLLSTDVLKGSLLRISGWTISEL